MPAQHGEEFPSKEVAFEELLEKHFLLTFF